MEWFDVRLCYPGKRGLYLVTDGESIDIMRYFGRIEMVLEWSSDTCNTFEPTHWMKLPKLPNTTS